MNSIRDLALAMNLVIDCKNSEALKVSREDCRNLLPSLQEMLAKVKAYDVLKKQLESCFKEG